MKTLSKIQNETNRLNLGLIFIIFSMAGLFLLSCDNNDIGLQDEVDSESTEQDAIDDFYLEDADDLATTALALDGNSGGKIASDGRFDCATITREGTSESGTVTIDFGEGCPGPRGNIRKGKIIIEFTGRYNVSGSNWTTRFEDYFINDVHVEGTRVVTNVSEENSNILAFTIVMEDGMMTWPNGSIARRRVNHKREEERDENHLLDRLIIYGTAEGNHRNGRGYYIEILEPLVYVRECRAEGVFIPVEGKKLIKHGEREITVDYGDGECDNTVTITNKNGRSWEYTVGGR